MKSIENIQKTINSLEIYIASFQGKPEVDLTESERYALKELQNAKAALAARRQR